MCKGCAADSTHDDEEAVVVEAAFVAAVTGETLFFFRSVDATDNVVSRTTESHGTKGMVTLEENSGNSTPKNRITSSVKDNNTKARRRFVATRTLLGYKQESISGAILLDPGWQTINTQSSSTRGVLL